MMFSRPRKRFEYFRVKIFTAYECYFSIRTVARIVDSLEIDTQRICSARIEEKEDCAIVVVGFRHIALTNLNRTGRPSDS